MLSPVVHAGIGLRVMRATHRTATARRHGQQAVGRGGPEERDREAADRGPEDAPAVHTLPVHEAPRVACSIGMTCVSNAVSAGRSKPAATPMRKTTARMPASPTRVGVEREHRQREGADDEQRPGDEDDRAAVAPVGDVAAEQHQGERRDGLDEAEQPERERVAGDLVRLERDDRRDRRHAERRDAARAEQRAHLGQAEQRPRRARDGRGAVTCPSVAAGPPSRARAGSSLPSRRAARTSAASRSGALYCRGPAAVRRRGSSSGRGAAR